MKEKKNMLFTATTIFFITLTVMIVSLLLETTSSLKIVILLFCSVHATSFTCLSVLGEDSSSVALPDVSVPRFFHNIKSFSSFESSV